MTPPRTHCFGRLTMSDDPVVQELDVVLSHELSSQLYLLQYPLWPAYRGELPHDFVGARIRPKHQVLARFEGRVASCQPSLPLVRWACRGPLWAGDLQRNLGPDIF